MPGFSKVALFSGLIAYAAAQKAGTVTPETNPTFPTQRCTRSGGCVTQQTKVSLDSNWRWTHDARANQYTNCYTGSTWNTSLCPDPDTCAANCALEGADYAGTYGINVSGNAITFKLVTRSSGTNVGGRVYLVAPSGTSYEKLTLVNQEFTFDVDVSQLPCGVNGALYTVEMPLNGDTSSANTAGVKYGTGYCDAQCPHDLKWIGGKGNVVGWNPSSTDSNAGFGQMGACCSENDIWEANSISNAFTPHTCQTTGLVVCNNPTQCGDGSLRYNGICDKDGCDFNPFRQGEKNFYGPGKTVNTNSKITVVSQYISSDGTNNGDLVQMRRYYVQNGVVIATPPNTWAGIGPENSLNDNFCVKQKQVFGDNPYFNVNGGMKGMGDSLKRGHVLAMSIWVDHAAHLHWLNSPYPLDADESLPGIARGTCAKTSGNPDDLVASAPNSQVTYSNIRIGELCSTFTNTGNVAECGPYVPVGSVTTTRTSTTSSRTTTTSSRTTTPTSRTTTTSSRTTTTSSRTTTTSSRTTTTTTTTRTTTGTGPTQTKWGQCGGIGYSGPTVCVSGTTCNVLNPYYSQCL